MEETCCTTSCWELVQFWTDLQAAKHQCILLEYFKAKIWMHLDLLSIPQSGIYCIIYVGYVSSFFCDIELSESKKIPSASSPIRTAAVGFFCFTIIVPQIQSPTRNIYWPVIEVALCMSFTKLLIPAMRLSFISNIDSINSIVIINSIIKGEGGRGGGILTRLDTES